MAFIGLRVPSETGRLIETIDVPGEKKKTSEYHVTILYLGKNLSIEAVAQAMMAAYNITSKTNPFVCGVKNISSFPENPDDGVPVILPVISPGLMKLRIDLEQSFKDSGVPYSNKYDFNPHVSVSFIKDKSSASYEAPMPGPLTWTASEIVIWGGNKNDEVVSISLPFVLGPLETIARKLI